MIDLFWSPRLDADNFRRLIEFEGLDDLEADGGAGGSRTFSPAITTGISSCSASPAAGSGSRRTSSRRSSRTRRSIRSSTISATRSGHQIVPRDGGIVRLYKALRRGGEVAILVDLALQMHQPTVAIDCFGLQTSVTYAHAWLAEKTGAPIVPAHAEPLPGGTLPDRVSPEARNPGRGDASTGGAALLGLIRAGCQAKSGALDVDV